MFFRRLINKFKEPIYKDDLKRVLLNGVVSSILIGVLSGLLDYTCHMYLNFSFIYFMIVIGWFVGTRIKGSYFTYHIFYSLLSVVLTLLGFILSTYAYYGMMFGFSGTFLFSVKVFFYQFNIFYKSFYDFWNIINVIFITFTLYLSWKLSKNDQ